MKYTREQIEEYIADDQRLANAVGGGSSLSADMLRQLLAENDALRESVKKANSQAEHFEREWYLRGDALESIALSGMSGSGQESEEGMRDWHAQRAWEFIGIAARALDESRKPV